MGNGMNDVSPFGQLQTATGEKVEPVMGNQDVTGLLIPVEGKTKQNLLLEGPFDLPGTREKTRIYISSQNKMTALVCKQKDEL